MELVLFLLAGFLWLAEGQSEWRLYIIGCYLLQLLDAYFFHLAVLYLPNMSIESKPQILYLTLSPSLQPGPLPFDGQEAYVLGCRWSGVYTKDPWCGKPFSVWCDMNNGGRWTVFQRWHDESENFYRGWADYENGFGNVKGEHWSGLKKISCLTSVKGKTKLRIDLDDFAGHSKCACYEHFHVGTLSTNYKLTIWGYQSWWIGAAGDSMTRCYSNNGIDFATFDRDNDGHSSVNYASSTYREGASQWALPWWSEWPWWCHMVLFQCYCTPQGITHFATQTWSWGGVAENLLECL